MASLPPSDFESGNAVLQTIHSSEGGRAFKLLQQRQKRAKEIENAKNDIENDTAKRRFTGSDRYQGSATEALEEQFKVETIGLVSAAEFREKRAKLNEKIEEKFRKQQPSVAAPQPKSRGPKAIRGKLSFDDDLDDDEDEDDAEDNDKNSDDANNDDNDNNNVNKNSPTSKASANQTEKDSSDKADRRSTTKRGKHFGKDLSAKTHFLPDPEREEMIARERERLTAEYHEEQEQVKREILEVTYSYWDGSGHRRNLQVRKGASIGEFLAECRKALEKEFVELRTTPAENLMYIKEDLILPHHITFYELIRSKARGKSGPLFHFDVHDDVRFVNDSRVEKDESHAGKIVDKKWYERNKHIFPASRWAVYDPSITYEKYTIHGHSDFSADNVIL
eukprot:Selendium_serpulae@DN5576_c0_g1_i1.p1